MTEVLIGSRAIKHWFPDFNRGASSDWDFLASTHDRPDIPTTEKIDVFVDERIGLWPWAGQYPIANPDELYTIKISHSFWEINRNPENWNKHAYDIIFLERQGATFLRPLYDILRPIWKERHGRKEVNLNQTKEKFFGDNVQRKYDHDSLHETVMYHERPLYERLLKPGSEVDCSWDLFLQLDQADKIKLCREEIMVTALERILIPYDYKFSPRRAYHWSLRRTCTSLFKNEWALFVLLNLDELFVPDIDYLALHKQRSDRLILNSENTNE